MNELKLPEIIRANLGQDAFAKIMQLQGRVYRDVIGRRTIQVNLADSSYFVKQHFGVGWGEIFKSFLSLKRPIIGALTEVKAIEKLTEIGIATTPLIGYGIKGCNPATQQSFIVTQDLGDIVSLEDICADWKNSPPDAEFKRKVMVALAQLASRLHGAGLSHRDFYLCHFVLKKSEFEQGVVNLILIDLHRMLMGQPSNGSAVMKDIAGLYFSMMDCDFTVEDWTLFRQYYLPQTSNFWLNVEERANRLYTKFHSDKFQKRLNNERAALKK